MKHRGLPLPLVPSSLTGRNAESLFFLDFIAVITTHAPNSTLSQSFFLALLQGLLILCKRSTYWNKYPLYLPSTESVILYVEWGPLVIGYSGASGLLSQIDTDT